MIASNPPKKHDLNLDFHAPNPFAALCLGITKRPLERLLHLGRIRSIYGQVSGVGSCGLFLERALSVMEITTCPGVSTVQLCSDGVPLILQAYRRDGPRHDIYTNRCDIAPVRGQEWPHDCSEPREALRP